MLAVSKIRKSLISTLVVLYVSCAFIAACPSSPVRDSFAKVIGPYLGYWGLFNSFGVYAPSAKHYNERLYAQITYADGRVATWNFPVTADSANNLWQHAQKCLWVFWHSKLGVAQDSFTEPIKIDAARYIVRLHRKQGTPVSVSIFREATPICLPGAKSVHGSGDKQLKVEVPSIEEIIRYEAMPEDLK